MNKIKNVLKCIKLNKKCNLNYTKYDFWVQFMSQHCCNIESSLYPGTLSLTLPAEVFPS